MPDCASIMETQHKTNPMCVSGQRLWDQIPEKGRFGSPHPNARETLRFQCRSRGERIRENPIKLGLRELKSPLVNGALPSESSATI